MKKLRAFTLIELMIAMAIIAILSTAGIQAYTGYVKKSRDTARAQIASNLNTAVIAYAGSNGGKPPADANAFDIFLASTSEAFGSSSVDVENGTLIKDPVGGKSVCLDAEGNATQPCAFHYTAYADGTYAISYGVEHESSTEENFYKTTNSVAALTEDTQQNPGTQVVMTKYGVYVGSAPYIGEDAVVDNGGENDGIDETYTPPGSITSGLDVVFRSIRVDASTLGGGEILTCDPACTNGNTCTNGVCMCGAGSACTGDTICTDEICEEVCPVISGYSSILSQANTCWFTTDLPGFYQGMRKTAGWDAEWSGNPNDPDYGDPCPEGSRLPTQEEWNALASDEGIYSTEFASSSQYQFSISGRLESNNGVLEDETFGFYWAANFGHIGFYDGWPGFGTIVPSYGLLVRCVYDLQ